MAHPRTLPAHVLDEIAAQLHPFITDGSHFLLGEAGILMTHTFEVWALSYDAIRQGTDDLSELAKQTDRWHHQISRGGSFDFFARSSNLVDQPDTWQVMEVFESQLASKIAAFAEWIDRNDDQDLLVRLLVVPAYQLTAFWLSDDKQDQGNAPRVPSKVLVIDSPERLRSLHPGDILRLKEFLLSEKEFLEALRKEEPVVGRSQADDASS